jgi:hypothetical protein
MRVYNLYEVIFNKLQNFVKFMLEIVPQIQLAHCTLGSSDFEIFFRNSICFMCFLFGLKILRLVYKKSVFWNTERFLFDLLSSEKSSFAPYKSWKKFLQNWPYRVSKEAEFCADFKKVLSLTKGKNFLHKNEFLGTSKILQKIVFLRKNL